MIVDTSTSRLRAASFKSQSEQPDLEPGCLTSEGMLKEKQQLYGLEMLLALGASGQVEAVGCFQPAPHRVCRFDDAAIAESWTRVSNKAARAAEVSDVVHVSCLDFARGLPEKLRRFRLRKPSLVLRRAGTTILYHTIPYYTTLYYTILHYTILYYTILYYTILYYTLISYNLI